MVPHAIATVSLATAVLPRLSAYAADHDLAGVARGVSSTLRTTLTLIVPFALLLPLVAYDLANLVFGWLAASEAFPDYALPLSLFGVGLVFFTVHYLMLRGYYSLELTRTVFWVQCVVAAANIALAITFTSQMTAEYTASALVLAYGGAYAVGAAVSYLLLRHLLGGLQTSVLVRFLVRLLIAAGIATGVSWAVQYGVHQLWPVDDTKLQSVVMLLLVGGTDVVLFLVLARAMRITEVTSLMDLVTARLPGRLGKSGKT
jgi:putative peptidoglycan lipid II flippase